MSIVSDFFAGGTEGLLKGVRDVASIFKADPLELAKLESAISKAEMDLELGLSQAQTRINEIEAASQDKFVSRWRPAIGWICAGAYAYTFILQPFAVFVLVISGNPIPHDQLPTLPLGELSMVLMGMLGLAGMRSYEKTRK